MDFTEHTKECMDNKSCPNGWLIQWSYENEILEPYAEAKQCHIYSFLTNKAMYGNTEGHYWSYKYPGYLSSCCEPDEITLRNELKEIIPKSN